MKLTTKTTIDKDVVEFDSSLGNGIDVYTSVDEYDVDTGLTLYFVSKSTGDVLKRLVVKADCGQNVGYVSHYEFQSMK